MLILVLITVLAAQQDSAAVCSFDTAAHLRTDSVVIALAAGPRSGGSSALRNEYADAAEVIHEYFQPPPNITVPLAARVFSPHRSHSRDTDDPSHGLDGDVQFQLDSAGRLTTGLVEVGTLVPEVAASVLAAILRADSARAFARPSERLLREDGIIRLHFAYPTTRLPKVMLLRVVVPALRVEYDPVLQFMPRVEYPAGLSTQISDRIVLQFVIDETGHVDTNTVQVIGGHFMIFADQILRVIPMMRYRPARIGKCALPALVRQPFDFKVRNSPFERPRIAW